MAFLRERGDRVTPFVLPKRGKRHYTEVWAEEDGAMALDTPQQNREKQSQNQPRGSIENMTDSIGETDSLSIGPLAARLLAAMRHEHRTPQSDDKSGMNGMPNGDISMNGGFDDDLGAISMDQLAEMPPAS